MTIRRTLATLVPAAALALLTGASAAHAQEIPTPFRAAELNAGTASTGLGAGGYVGVGISAVVPEVPGTEAIQVLGVQLGYQTGGAQQTFSTLGEPFRAALLHAGTVSTGLGANGEVGAGIVGVQPGVEVRGVQTQSDESFLSYEERLRQFTSEGFRVQSGHIHLNSLSRELMAQPEGNVEVLGVQLGDVDASGEVTYEERLRQFTSEGFRVQSGHVSSSSLVRR